MFIQFKTLTTANVSFNVNQLLADELLTQCICYGSRESLRYNVEMTKENVSFS